MALINKAASLEDAFADNFIQEEEVIEQPIQPIVSETIQEPVNSVENAAEEPVVEHASIEPEKVIERVEVEKIVEKYPAMSEYSEKLLKALQEGRDDDVYNYLREKKKDYQSMSDFDVVKEGLKKSNPKWTDKDIQIELKAKYGTLSGKKDLDSIDQESFPEDYDKAVAFNERVDEKELLLSRDARDFRYQLEEQKQNVEFPKITSEQQPVNNVPTQEEIAESNRQWESHVDAELPKLSEIKFKIGNEDATYKISDEDKVEIAAFMKNFTGEAIAKDLGWIDENGNENVLKIAEDRLKLKQFDKIMASSSGQVKSATIKEVISKDIKNLNLDGRSTSVAATAKSFEDQILDAGR